MLRPYQIEAVNKTREAFKAGAKRLILCAPTGAGKTIIFSHITEEAIKKGRKVLILCDRKELIKQTKSKLNALNLHPVIIAPKHEFKETGLYLASVDTLRNRPLPEIDLLIIDEAHKQTFDKIIKSYLLINASLFVIGATATPLRTKTQNPLKDLYNIIIEPINIPSLIEGGFLAPARSYSNKIDLSNIAISRGEYDNTALYKEFDTPKLYDGLIDNYNKYAKGLKSICFCVNVAHCIKTAEAFNLAGISARYLHGGTQEAEREEITAGFTAGAFLVLVNCGVLTTGYDEPSIEAVLVNRATLSLALWLQMTGRGARTFENKRGFIILDMGANIYRFGFWEDLRQWTLEPPKKTNSDGVAPVKNCKNCNAMLYASARICKYCGTVCEVKKAKLQKAELIEVKSVERGAVNNKEIDRLKLIAKEKGYKIGWVYKMAQIMKLKGG